MDDAATLLSCDKRIIERIEDVISKMVTVLSACAVTAVACFDRHFIKSLINIFNLDIVLLPLILKLNAKLLIP